MFWPRLKKKLEYLDISYYYISLFCSLYPLHFFSILNWFCFILIILCLNCCLYRLWREPVSAVPTYALNYRTTLYCLAACNSCLTWTGIWCSNTYFTVLTTLHCLVACTSCLTWTGICCTTSCTFSIKLLRITRQVLDAERLSYRFLPL